jgi:hypothetical protein
VEFGPIQPHGPAEATLVSSSLGPNASCRRADSGLEPPHWSASVANEQPQELPLASSFVSPIIWHRSHFISPVTGGIEAALRHRPPHLPSEPCKRQPPPSVKSLAPLVHLLPSSITFASSLLGVEILPLSRHLLVAVQATVSTKTESS